MENDVIRGAKAPQDIIRQLQHIGESETVRRYSRVQQQFEPLVPVTTRASETDPTRDLKRNIHHGPRALHVADENTLPRPISAINVTVFTRSRIHALRSVERNVALSSTT